MFRTIVCLPAQTGPVTAISGMTRKRCFNLVLFSLREFHYRVHFRNASTYKHINTSPGLITSNTQYMQLV